MDFSSLLPPGIGIYSVSLSVWRNLNPAQPAPSDFTVGTPFVLDRAVYCTLSGGMEGNDYQLRWLINDSAGNQWQRTALVLCSQTS